MASTPKYQCLCITEVSASVGTTLYKLWGALWARRNHRITESQNHRITESQNGGGWKGPLWVTQSNLLPKQGYQQ